MPRSPSRRRLRFNVAQICYLTLLVALAVGWWVERVRLRHRLERERQALREADLKLRRIYAEQKARDDEALMKTQVELRFAQKRIDELEQVYGVVD